MANEHDRRKLRWQPGWKLTLFYVFFLPLLIALGFWQLDRAEQKRQIVANEVDQRSQPARPLTALLANDSLAYVSVMLSGQFDNDHYFLVDNQQYRGRFGYEIISPFFDQASQQTVLVSRGWLRGSLDRRELPAVEKITTPVNLVGEIYVPLGEPFLLAEQQFDNAWPKVIQAVEVAKLAALLDGDVFPYVVRLDDDQAGVLERHWQLVNVPVAKHTGYAVQWFVMAIVLTALYVMTGFGKFGRKSLPSELE